MKTIKRMISSPRTTIPGIVGILGGIGLIVRDVGVLLDPVLAAGPVTSILLGLGMLFAADAKQVEEVAEEVKEVSKEQAEQRMQRMQ